MSSNPHYHNLTWRLDMELSRRSLTVMNKPVYQLKLDLKNNQLNKSNNIFNHNNLVNSSDAVSLDKDKYVANGDITSIHLQSDLQNMKNLQNKLQAAIDSLNSVNSQRIIRYIQ